MVKCVGKGGARWRTLRGCLFMQGFFGQVAHEVAQYVAHITPPRL